MKKAIFGAGCFWGVQYKFDQLKGVMESEVGYAGGHTQDPSYKEVCTDETGHAEVVLLHYDESQIRYEELLKTFWSLHDPTQLNRQGVDVGSQYRTVIFYFDEEQKKQAEASKAQIQNQYDRPVVTEILPAPPFYRAEEYHQKYNIKNGGTCHI